MRKALCIVAFAIAFVGFAMAAGTREDTGGSQVNALQDPIPTKSGWVSGVITGKPGFEVHSYRGIPYAAPPVGALRWKAPQPVKPWVGIRECTTLTKWPPQSFPTVERYGSIPESFMSEDCLYLNVHVPVRTDGKLLPVMVWLHGGGLTNQSGSRDIYNMPFLPDTGKVIQVSVVHRLGPIGYLAHPALSAESSQGVSGNYGNLDILAALKWVKENIAAFGGDPDNVTLFGQSGGGTKTATVVASPLAKGLLDKAIVMSGCIDGTPLKDAEKIGVDLAEKLGITGTGPEALAALRALSWQEIILTGLKAKYSADHTIDGWYLPESVSAIFKAGKQNDIPLIMGFTESDIPDYAIQGVASVVSQMKMLKSPVYPYMFTYLPKNWKADGAKAWHSLDVGYIFGNPRLIAPVNFGDYGKRAGAVTPNPGFGSADDAMAAFMMKTWAQFARSGDPSLPGGVKWPVYSRDKDQYITLDSVPEVKNGYSAIVTK